jgi:hypothetical protein
MHPLHDYIARQLAERLKTRRAVVWYDPRCEFLPFIEELRGGPAPPGTTSAITIGDERAQLAEYGGSYFELRAIVEPLVSEDIPEPVLIYVPGRERDRRGSVLMELEKISEVDGSLFGQALKSYVRQVLGQRHTAGVVDEVVERKGATYLDFARAVSDDGSAEPPSILKSIFHDASGNDAILATWLMSNAHDTEIQSKEAARELTKLVQSRLKLELPETSEIPKLRAITLRYVLAGEFRADLRCPPPPSLDSVPAPKTKDDEETVRTLARRLRATFPDEYAELAGRAEGELGLRDANVPAEALGSIDTFPFEERRLLVHCGELITEGRFDEAMALVNERERSFWLDRDMVRKAHWEACRLMAELGEAARTVHAAVARIANGPGGWVEAYTKKDAGWYRLDRAQRRLETLVAKLEEEPDERALGVVRRAYENACNAMAQGFTKAFAKADWTVPVVLQQTHVWSDVLTGRPKPVAYLLIDALRFEMGIELAERLPKTAEVSVRPALAALPTITPIGMAALLPGAAGSFSVVEQDRKLGARIEDAFLPDRMARKKHLAARVPKLIDLELDELLGLSATRLKNKIGDAQVVLVRSQEIDYAGETGFTRQARRAMDEVIGDLATALQRLARAGIEHAVVAADHGHLFFPGDRDESMRINSPGGDQVELHRRCWIGRGGATPAGCVRVAASALGYASDLDFVFPVGCGIFRSGGDLAYYHGGPTLQELVIPVLTVRLKFPGAERSPASPVHVSGSPEAITNRIFSVTFELGDQNLSLFSSSLLVRPVLMAGSRQVGAAIVAIEGDFDRTTGCVTLQSGKPATVGFQLSDDSIQALRVVVLDPATDAELYRSPADIPVRVLG